MKKFLLTFAVAAVLSSAAYAQQKTDMESSKTLVAYFSATGTTAAVAQTIAQVSGGELYAIEPERAYTPADLNWNDRNSRSSIEMNDRNARPALKAVKENMAEYDIVFIGYPIWWDEAPRVINTFIENHDLSGKKVIPFATSGGSGVGNSVSVLKKTYPDLDWKEGRLLNGSSKSAIQKWVGSLKAGNE